MQRSARPRLHSYYICYRSSQECAQRVIWQVLYITGLSKFLDNKVCILWMREPKERQFAETNGEEIVYIATVKYISIKNSWHYIFNLMILVQDCAIMITSGLAMAWGDLPDFRVSLERCNTTRIGPIFFHVLRKMYFNSHKNIKIL